MLPKDTTLPFFKQFFGGGSNKYAGWPAGGIGRGSNRWHLWFHSFNDRTGDIQLETNIEYRYNILQIIPNSLVLRGPLFADIGNVWNFRNSKPGVVQTVPSSSSRTSTNNWVLLWYRLPA
ncbi:MAG: BamA/TamA family outer membrane protein [Chitinophagaceae bacterium]|nr:BamA/TamA family outer membrane protein [Chitinophagaceae bacterium]